MKEIEVHAVVLDRLVSELKRGEKRYINLLEELTGEVNFRDLRASVYYLSELGFVDHDGKIPDNEGFYCKITKDGLRYHQDIFEPASQKKLSWTERMQSMVQLFESTRTLAVVVFILIVLIFGLNAEKIMEKFPALASLLNVL